MNEQYFTNLNGYLVKDGKAIHTYENVNSMKSDTTIREGTHIKTKGYYSVNDGGSGEYVIVDDDTLVSDNGLIHTLTNGLKAVLISEEIYPELCGAKGDGTTDDTNAIQTAINTANTKGVPLNLGTRTYLITEPLTVYSNLEINGNNAIIKTNSNINMITTNSVVDHVYLHNFRLMGANDITYTDNIGIKITAYYSKFQDLIISNCYTSISMETTGATGTLVENRYINLRCSNYCKYGLYIGVSGNNKLTDGFINNLICNGNSNSTESSIVGLVIGSAAGYNINGLHFYGKNTRAMVLSNSYNSNISNVYIEGFEIDGKGIYLSATQIGVNLSNVFINHNKTDSTGDAIYAEMSTYLPSFSHIGNLSNIRINRGSSTNGKSIKIVGAKFNAENIAIAGETRTIENDCTGILYSSKGIIKVNDSTIETKEGSTLFSKFSGYLDKGITPTTTSFTYQIPVSSFDYSNDIAMLEIKGVGGVNHIGSIKIFNSFIKIVKTSSGFSADIKVLNNDIFTADPTVSIDSTGLLTVTCEVISSVYATLFCNYYQKRDN